MTRISSLHIICFAALLLLSSVAPGQSADLIGPYQLFEDARSRNDFEAAAGFAKQAADLTEQQYGGGSPEHIDALERLGNTLVMAGRLREGEEQLLLALAGKEQKIGSDHPDLVPLLEALAEIQQQLQDFSAAESSLRRILEIERGVYGDKHQYVVATLEELRDVLNQAGETDAADVIEREIEAATTTTRDFDLLAGEGEQRYATNDGYATVRVFYGTNRARTGEQKAAQFYGTDRGELDLGYLDVSIPETHQYGALESESRFSIYTYVLGEEAKKRKFVLLQNVTPLDSDDFYSQLHGYVDNAPSNDVFVFVHGYNVTFEDAARRAAQLAYDLDFDGTPMMYSWPSQASTAAYTVDEAVVRPSGRKLATMLDNVVQQSGADRIHLIAHSMGNRALVEALQTYVTVHGQEKSQGAFDQVVLTAPDVDRDYFIDVMSTIGNVARRTTLYASENDVALKSSRILHGAPRAGLAGEAIVVLPGIDTIDMSAVEADLLGHSYFAADEGPIYDMFRLFWRNDPPSARCGMSAQDAPDQGFWLFDVDNCRGGELLTAAVLFKRLGPLARPRIEDHINGLVTAEQETEKLQWSQILDRLNSLFGSD